MMFKPQRTTLAAAIMGMALGLGIAPQTAVADDLVAKGEKVFKKCKACHMVGEGAKNKVGPELNNIYGRTAGALEGYRFSTAMTEKGEEGLVWNDETLAGYLENPRKYVPKTKMAFSGLRKETDRDAILAYLKSYSD